MYRFSVTHEFEEFTLEDWLDNSKWFSIKLLVDLNGGDFTKSLNNRSYADAIKMILLFLGIAAMHLLLYWSNPVSQVLRAMAVKRTTRGRSNFGELMTVKIS
jgi:hypothetical protein